MLENELRAKCVYHVQWAQGGVQSRAAQKYSCSSMPLRGPAFEKHWSNSKAERVRWHSYPALVIRVNELQGVSAVRKSYEKRHQDARMHV
jgi:hypothetical protein